MPTITLFDAVETELRTARAALNNAVRYMDAIHDAVNTIKVGEHGEKVFPIGRTPDDESIVYGLKVKEMGAKEVLEASKDWRPSLSERMSEELFSAIHQAIGNASMCWTNIYGAGTFDASRASNIAFELCHLVADEMESLIYPYTNRIL